MLTDAENFNERSNFAWKGGYIARVLSQAHEQQGNLNAAFTAYQSAHEAMMTTAGRVSAMELRDAFLTSPQVAFIQEDIARLERPGT